MTEKEIKDFLNQGRRLNDEIKALEMQLNQLDLEQERIISSYKSLGVSFSPKASAKFEKIIDKKLDLSIKINDRILELNQKKAELFDFIEKADNVNYRLILIHRFINLYSWKKIARLTHYNYEYLRSELIQTIYKDLSKTVID